jgi:hypothetical protein
VDIDLSIVFSVSLVRFSLPVSVVVILCLVLVSISGPTRVLCSSTF